MTKPLTIIDLTDQFVALLDAAEQMEEGTDTFDALLDELTACGMAIEDKADSYAAVIDRLKADQAMLEERAAALMDRAIRLSRNIDQMKKRLQSTMELTNMRKFKTNTYSFSIVKNPKSVKIENEALIPSEYIKEKVTTRIDKKQLKEDLSDGLIIPGAMLIQTERLDIR